MKPLRVVLIIALAVGLSACQNEPSPSPVSAEQMYGDPVPVSDAIPVPALCAEPDRYRGRRLTVDGRIASVGTDGCSFRFETPGDTTVVVEAVRRDAGTCAWSIEPDADGVAATQGTLRIAGDTLRLSATGVQRTPLSAATPDG